MLIVRLEHILARGKVVRVAHILTKYFYQSVSTIFIKYLNGRNNSLTKEVFNMSKNYFSSKDRNNKLRNVVLEPGHVYLVNTS